MTGLELAYMMAVVVVFLFMASFDSLMDSLAKWVDEKSRAALIDRKTATNMA